MRYDENGNVISHMKGAEMTYDSRGHLASITLGTRTSVSYLYDHTGRLIARFGPEDQDITQFFYAHEGKPHLISHVYKPHQVRNLIIWLFSAIVLLCIYLGFLVCKKC